MPPLPLKPGEGPNVTTLRLQRDGPLLVFRPVGIARVAPKVFSAFGWMFLLAAPVGLWHSPGDAVGTMLGGAVAIGFGRFLANLFRGGACVDTGRRRIDAGGGAPIDFDAVESLELLPKRLTDTELNDYDNTELNLVLRTGRRVHLVSQPDGDGLALEARELAEVIGTTVIDRRHGRATAQVTGRRS